MTLRLTIENQDRLPDGGPMQVEIDGRGLDVGRDQHLDWTLPDPSRYISGKHCEIRFRDGGYWLSDVSTNGTFLNGADFRMQSPYRLRGGDRLTIGQYIVRVDIPGEVAAPPPGGGFGAGRPAPGAPGGDLWGSAGTAAPPVERAAVMAPRAAAPPPTDFLDWAAALDPMAAPFPGVGAPPPIGHTPPPGLPPLAPTPAPPAGLGGGFGAGFDRLPPLTPPAAPITGDLWGAPAPAAAPVDWGAPPPATPMFPDAAALDEASIPRPRRPAPVDEPPLAPLAPPRPAAEPPPAAAGFAALPLADPYALPPRAEASAPLAPPPAATPSFAAPFDAPFDPGPAAPGAGDAALLARIARAAGLPPDAFARRDPGAVADEIGALIRLSADELRQMLAARAETKSLVRSSSRTMVQAFDNNPLKFSPTTEDALKIMFGPRTRSYLDGPGAVREGFADLKAHQLQTYGAMQGAIEALFEDLSPDRIDSDAGSERGFGGLVGSRKARLWDVYVERWKAKAQRHDGRLVDAFMLLFAECYDRLQRKDR